MYAHHRERCASGKQHPQEHRPCLVEPTKGVRQRQEPQSLRPERLHRGRENQTPPAIQRDGGAGTAHHRPHLAGTLLWSGQGTRSRPYHHRHHAGAQRPMPRPRGQGLCPDYRPPL